MGCSVAKSKKNKEQTVEKKEEFTIKQYDPRLQQVVSVPILGDAHTNPLMKRRAQNLAGTPDQVNTLKHNNQMNMTKEQTPLQQ